MASIYRAYLCARAHDPVIGGAGRATRDRCGRAAGTFGPGAAVTGTERCAILYTYESYPISEHTNICPTPTSLR